MRLKVYEGLFSHGPCTANELFKRMGGKHQNAANITTRLGELREMGVATELNKKVCEVTGMTVTEWDVTSALPKSLSKPKTKRQIIEEALTKISETQEILANPDKVTRQSLIDRLDKVKRILRDAI